MTRSMNVDLRSQLQQLQRKGDHSFFVRSRLAQTSMTASSVCVCSQDEVVECGQLCSVRIVNDVSGAVSVL